MLRLIVIVQAYPPSEELDKELAAWLEKVRKGKTVLISLGRLFKQNAGEERNRRKNTFRQFEVRTRKLKDRHPIMKASVS